MRGCFLNMSKFTAKKRLLSKKLVTAYDSSKYEYCKSFNELSMDLIRNNDIRYLIVGTLTPPEGRKNGYFYTASKNKMFRYIDLSFNDDDDGLCLEQQKNNPEKIKNILCNRHVAFFDVVNEAIVLKGSSRDDDILSYTLDYDRFEEILSKNQEIKIAVNSRNAETGFKQICNELKKDIKYELIPQNIWGNSRIYKSELSLINKWKSFFD